MKEEGKISGLKRMGFGKRCLPPRQVVSTLVCRDGTLIDEDGDKDRTSEQGQGIEQLVHLWKLNYVSRRRNGNGNVGGGGVGGWTRTIEKAT